MRFADAMDEESMANLTASIFTEIKMLPVE
jgi:hypothetical protein